MKEDDLRNVFEVNKKARKKAIKWTIIMVLITNVILIIPLIIVPGKKDIILLLLYIPFIGLYVAAYLMFYRIFQDEIIGEINISLATKCLSEEKLTEVIPMDASDYKNFILGLVNIAKFYARISKEESEYVEVYVKILDESGARFFENIRKEYFFKYYTVIEDNEQEDKKDPDSIVNWE